MKPKYILFLLSILVVAASCKKLVDERPFEEKIATLWINGNDTLRLKEDHSFIHHKKEDSKFLPLKEGKWTLEGDSAIIFYSLPENAQYPIDSTVVTFEEGNKVAKQYYDGKLIFNEADTSHAPGVKKIRYTVGFPTEESIQFSQSGTLFTFEVPTEKFEGSISFESIYRGVLGMASLIFIAFLFSSNRRAINWSQVGKGIAIQLIFAIAILKVPFIADVFSGVSQFFVEVINFTQEGTEFLFGGPSGKIENPLATFAIKVLPTIIFFSALTSLLYYWGVLQKIVYVFAIVMKRFMGLSGAESMAAAGNIFLGQTESPLLVKPYLNKMTDSELMCLMAGGMATIAGGVLAAYIGFLGGDDPNAQLYFARHLLAASVMSAPAAIVLSKILVPETEKFDRSINIPKEKLGTNSLEAITNGTTEGLKLAVNVGAMLLVFIALMAMANYVLGDMIGEWTGLNEVITKATGGKYESLSFQYILGYTLAPIAWLMGVPWADVSVVGQLLGEKSILNEFVAYSSLGELKNEGAFAYNKSIVMSTYILCGFANFASIGIQIGGIGSLVPEKKHVLSKYGVKALIGGTLACLMTAVMVGMLV